LNAPITSGGVDRCCSNVSTSTNQDVNGFAWQLGAGVNYTVAPDVQLGVGYRYFKGPSFDPIFIGKLGVPASEDNESHAVQVNLTVGIN
jgi:outer membrane autotransporter protein